MCAHTSHHMDIYKNTHTHLFFRLDNKQRVMEAPSHVFYV